MEDNNKRRLIDMAIMFMVFILIIGLFYFVFNETPEASLKDGECYLKTEGLVYRGDCTAMINMMMKSLGVIGDYNKNCSCIYGNPMNISGNNIYVGGG